MNKNNYNLIILVACIFIGVLFVINYHIDDENTYFNLSSKEYQELNTEKGNLLKDISKIKESNDEIIYKINDYKRNENNSGEILKNVNEEINYNNMIIGFTPVEGEGIEIQLSDGVDDISEEDASGTLLLVKTLHDNDMMEVVNELKMAGAEAISINNQRVILNSEIMCRWAFISINGIKTPGPFTIKAIGNSSIMKSVLSRSDGYLQMLKNRDINVYITEKKSIEIPSYNGSGKVSDFKNLSINN